MIHNQNFIRRKYYQDRLLFWYLLLYLQKTDFSVVMAKIHFHHQNSEISGRPMNITMLNTVPKKLPITNEVNKNN